MEINAMFRTGSMAAVAVVSVAAAGDINLVQGGTFEAVPQGAAGSPCFSTHLPLIPGWQSSLRGFVDRLQNTASCGLQFAPNPNGGDLFISLQGSICCGCDNNGWISQMVPTSGGKRYLIDFDAVLEPTDVLRITAGSASWSLMGDAAYEWKHYTIQFMAAGPTSLRFESQSSTGSTPTPWGGCWESEGCHLDNIRVSEVPPCIADVIDNGFVDGADLSALLGAWGTAGGLYPRADANGDGVVNGSDLAIVLSGWGPCP
ncbi:MAG: hypothetical protein ACKOYN_09295 [Planctomycetota bacterium]